MDPMDPFKNLKPNFGPFATIFGSWAGIVLALVWAITLIFCAVQLVIGLGQLARARQAHNPDEISDRTKAIIMPLVGTVAAVSAPIIWAVITTMKPA